MKKERTEITSMFAWIFHNIRTFHSKEHNNELRFRIVSDHDKTSYIRTEATQNGNWQEAHYHTQVLETYIVQEGWIGLVTKHGDIITYNRYCKNEIFTIPPHTVHNIYMSSGAVTHTIKHGNAQKEERVADDEFTAFTSQITEVSLIKLIEEKRDAKVTPDSVAKETKPSEETYWELFEERRHLENIVNTRFNFFLVIFGLVLASLFTMKTKEQFISVLLVGIIIEIALLFPIMRAEAKLTFYLKYIRSLPNHAERAANSFANSVNVPWILRRSYHKILGYYLPVVICIALIVSLILHKPIFEGISSKSPDNEITIRLKIDSDPSQEYTYKVDTSKSIQINVQNELNDNLIDASEDTIN